MTETIDALQRSEFSQPVAKLKHFQGQVASPEQLQKQLLELSELSMQVVLSMDDLHSEAREVQASANVECLNQYDGMLFSTDASCV